MLLLEFLMLDLQLKILLALHCQFMLQRISQLARRGSRRCGLRSLREIRKGILVREVSREVVLLLPRLQPLYPEQLVLRRLVVHQVLNS
jgi:hypothetical protein